MLPDDTCCGQDLCQLDRSTATKYGRKTLSQFLMNNSGGERQAIRFIHRGRHVCAAHNVFYGIDAIICAVMTQQGMFFLFTEPVTGACKQFLFQLGLDLRMLYFGAVYIVLHFNTDESAATRRVTEQVGTVTCSDERSDTGGTTGNFSDRLCIC